MEIGIFSTFFGLIQVRKMSNYIKIAIPLGDQLIQDVWINSYVSSEKALFELFDAVEPNKKKKREAPDVRWQLREIFRSVSNEGTNSPLYPAYAEMCAKVLWRAAMYPSNEMKEVHLQTGMPLRELTWECIRIALRAIAVAFELRCVLDARYRVRKRASKAGPRKAANPQLAKIQKSFAFALEKSRAKAASSLHKMLEPKPGKTYTDADLRQALLEVLVKSASDLIAPSDRKAVKHGDFSEKSILKEMKVARTSAVTMADFLMKDYAKMRFRELA